MPDSYNSVVGEWGISWVVDKSAHWYCGAAWTAQILILDEATSALDTQTEKSVMKSLDQLSDDLTVIMIAHRLSTVETFDRVVKIENGVVVADGTPQSVLNI